MKEMLYIFMRVVNTVNDERRGTVPTGCTNKHSTCLVYQVWCAFERYARRGHGRAASAPRQLCLNTNHSDNTDEPRYS
jgi:hypothetical protein